MAFTQSDELHEQVEALPYGQGYLPARAKVHAHLVFVAGSHPSSGPQRPRDDKPRRRQRARALYQVADAEMAVGCRLGATTNAAAHVAEKRRRRTESAPDLDVIAAEDRLHGLQALNFRGEDSVHLRQVTFPQVPRALLARQKVQAHDRAETPGHVLPQQTDRVRVAHVRLQVVGAAIAHETAHALLTYRNRRAPDENDNIVGVVGENPLGKGLPQHPGTTEHEVHPVRQALTCSCLHDVEARQVAVARPPPHVGVVYRQFRGNQRTHVTADHGRGVDANGAHPRGRQRHP